MSELKKREISGTEAAYYTVAYEKGQARTYELDMFLYIGSYCYKLTVASTDMDDEAFKMVAESFNAAALDAEATGKLMGVQPPDYSETTPYVNEENGYSLEIPVSWGPSGYGTGIVDSILDITLNVIPAYADGKTLEEAAKKNAEQLESVLSLGEMKQTTVGGYPAYKMEIAETEEGAAAQGDYTALYVVDGKNGAFYLIVVSIGEANYTPQTVKLVEGVLASFKALPLPAREETPQEEEGPKKTFDPFA